MQIEWQQGASAHDWTADIADIYHLRITPEIASGAITYRVQLHNASMRVLAQQSGLVSVESAKAHGVYMTWKHCAPLATALVGALDFKALS